MQNREIEIHPAANIFPMMKEAEYQALKADIAENGVNVWMTFYDGKLLDGRNRHKACVELGIIADHYSEQIDVDLIPDPVAWVLSLNLHRRHITETQRAVIAAKIANLKHGGDRKSKIKPSIDGLNSTQQAADQLNVKPSSVERAKSAIKAGCNELVESMERDEISPSLAASFAKAVPSKVEQAKILEGGKKAVQQVVKESKNEPEPVPKKKGAVQKPVKLTDNAQEADGVTDAFSKCENRLDTLRRIIATLEPHEAMAAMEWLSDKLELKQ